MSTLKVTNIKAADGTSALSIADSTGVVGVNKFTDLAGTGAPDFPNGLTLANNATTGNITGVTLDDYEEGTWTPSFTGGNITYPSGMTYTGQYIKVGNIVHLSARIVSTVSGWSWSNINSYLIVAGLPFAIATRRGGGVITTADISVSGTKGVVYSAGNTNLYIYGFEATTQGNLKEIILEGTFEVS